MLSEEDSRALIKPYRDVLAQSLRGAVDDWGALLALPKSAALTGGISPRTRAGYIHDRVVNRLQQIEIQGSVPGLRMVKIRGLWVVVVRDQLILKLKKLDKSLRSRNIPTLQTKSFDEQSSVLSLAASATNATGGYVLDPLTTMPLYIVAVCWNGRQRLWEIPLEDVEDGQVDGSVTVPLDVGPASPSEKPTRTRIADEARTSKKSDEADE